MIQLLFHERFLGLMETGVGTPDFETHHIMIIYQNHDDHDSPYSALQGEMKAGKELGVAA